MPGISDIDRMRSASGRWGYIAANNNDNQAGVSYGICYWEGFTPGNITGAGPVYNRSFNPAVDLGRAVPTADVTRPKTLAMLACAWLGLPAA